MIRDITESFKKAVKKDKKVILDNYVLKDGVYFKLDINKSFNQIDESRYLIFNKKDEVPVDKLKLEKWFKERDYLSSVLNDDTNKAIDLPAKKIHSTNYLTIFIKKDVFPEIGKHKSMLSKQILKERLNKFFEKLVMSEKKFEEMMPKCNLKGKAKTETKEKFLQQYFSKEINYLRSSDRKEKINKYKNYILSNLDEFIEFMKVFNENNKFGNYIKLFFEAPIEEYENENRIYVIPRIFNVNDYNLVENEQVLGLPSRDITTNSKKPYLILKTMKCKISNRDTAKNVEFTKDFYDWLKKKSKEENGEIKLQYDYKFNSNISYDSEKSFYSIHTDTSNQIDDFDNIPIAQPNINFTMKNIVKAYKWDNKKNKYLKYKFEEDLEVTSLPSLQQLISKYYFNGNMNWYFKDRDPDIVSNKFTPVLKVLFMNSKDAFFDYFHKGIDINIKKMINKITMESIEEQIKNTVKGTNVNKIRQAYNLRLLLLKYFKIKGGKEMASKVKEFIESLNSKLNAKENVYCESDKEFYFIAGQLAYYIVSQSEASNKTFGLFEPFLVAKNSKQLKRKLTDVFQVYKHAISINNVRFKNAMAMVMGYEKETKIKDEMKDMLLAGILSNNIFYEKKKEQEVKNNEK